MEHPVHPLPCSHITFGPPGLAMSFFKLDRSLIESPIAEAEIVQYFYEKHTAGIPHISQHRALENLESKSKSLKDAFRSRKGAKNMLFESPHKGMYRLKIRIPENSR